MFFKFPKSSKVGQMTYILVHGAWHANWCWRRVTPLLEKQGHKVITPNLPGHGEDKTPFKDISLQSYVKRITEIIHTQNQPVMLVGHSMAGVVISQVAEEIPEGINKLIYVCGFVPDYNGSLVHEEGKTKTPSVTNQIEIHEQNCEISLKQSPRLKELFYGQCSNEEAIWAVAQLQKQPLRPFIETVDLSDEKFGSVDKMYIECLRDEAITIEDQRRMNNKIKCEVKILDTDHAPFLSKSNELVKILDEASLKSEHEKQTNLTIG